MPAEGAVTSIGVDAAAVVHVLAIAQLLDTCVASSSLASLEDAETLKRREHRVLAVGLVLAPPSLVALAGGIAGVVRLAAREAEHSRPALRIEAPIASQPSRRVVQLEAESAVAGTAVKVRKRSHHLKVEDSRVLDGEGWLELEGLASGA